MVPRSKASRRGRRDTSWWNLWPDLYKQELDAFDRKGISYRIRLKKKGLLALAVDWPIKGRELLRLHIGFSPLHPFFRPAVAAPQETFERHQNPFNRDLCLITRETGQWDSRKLIADFIDERLQQLLGALEARRQERWEDAAELEEQAADPWMPYFEHATEDSSIILFDGRMSVPHADHGLMDLVLWTRPFNNGQPIEAVLRQLKKVDGSKIGRTFNPPGNPPQERQIPGRWVRLSKPPFTDDPTALLVLVTEELERREVLRPKDIRKLNQIVEEPFSITGIVFPEEVEYDRAKTGAGWLFLVSRREFMERTPGPPQVSLVRGERAGEQEIFARLPVANALRARTVLLVGCGAIGSFATVELARAGVGNLVLLDADVVQPGNSLRWPLGRRAWGVKKSVALKDFIDQNYPRTKVAALHGRLGSGMTNAVKLPARLENGPSQLAQIRDLIQDADLVIDASASTEVQHALNFHCRDLEKPLVMGYATEGLAGGVVARFTSRSDACWVCLNEHWNDANKDGPLPKLRVDKTGVVTPIGCNEPTFTGGSFDLQEVSLEIVRSAIGLLADGAYDPGNWSVAILELRDDRGHRILPKWTNHNPPPHPSCRCGTK